ncbi:hypothetical protein [Paucibacter soli]|uniref:hypothetical protein n=1 Tax=Paucibacter soli TaxID=3133433 RepID=UPI0030A73053
MSIIIFWQAPDGSIGHEQFKDKEFQAAQQLTVDLRKAGNRHVCFSSELENCVGKSGVDTVENGHLPNGEKYDWSKAHRGAGPRNS